MRGAKGTITVWTKAKLLANTSKEGACLVWLGSYTDSGAPGVHHRGKREPVRRLLLQLAGVEVPPGHVVGRTEECTNPGCICQAHTVVRSLREHLTHVTKGKNETESSRAKRRIASRKRSRITTEQAQAICSEAGTLKEIAGRYGISFQTVSRIKRGESWRDSGNPFAGLGA